MSGYSWLQISIFLFALVLCVKPLGGYMARIYEGEKVFLSKILGPLEHFLCKSMGFKTPQTMPEMHWRQYAKSLLLFHFLGFLVVYLLQRLQGHLFLNPQNHGNVPPMLAMNTAISFVTNTNWQAYAGESTLGHLVQVLGLTVQNFVSAATGMSVAVALIRALSRNPSKTIGNFWVDLTRSTLYILLPLSLALALVLVSQGVTQTLLGSTSVPWMQSGVVGNSTIQILSLGPVASQAAIKQLGTNGGGFFNANAAHPFENPTPLSNFLQMLSILMIPAAFCYTFGKMVRNTKQGWAVFATMFILLTALLVGVVLAEQQGNPMLSSLGIDQTTTTLQSGGNMEGKEVRFGIANSALWATVTTAASNGSVNAMHDSFTPLGGLIPMWLMQLGEVVFGGAGSGLYGMLVFVIVAVFVAGLMVGRTPEYLGKKIEAFEMKMASLVILLPAATVLLSTALAVATKAGTSSISNSGPHGFGEVLYAFSSAANNNGSAFAGLNANTNFYNLATALCMLIGRFWVAIPILALAGSLAQKKPIPTGPGTLATTTPLFVLLLLGVVILVGALTFLPALTLGPIVEHIQLHSLRLP